MLLGEWFEFKKPQEIDLQPSYNNNNNFRVGLYQPKITHTEFVLSQVFECQSGT